MNVNVQIVVMEGDDSSLTTEAAAQAIFDALQLDPAKDTLTVNTTTPPVVVTVGENE